MSDVYQNPDIETITSTKLKLRLSWSISIDKIKKLFKKNKHGRT